MKVDNTFDKTELKRLLNAEYELTLQVLTFFPEGEDSYGYIATASTGEKYFVKASTFVPEAALQVSASLHDSSNITEVVAPLKTKANGLSIRWQNFRVSLFPFIEGKSRWDLWKAGKDFSDNELASCGELLAKIHACSEIEAITVATYELPLRHELFAVLDAAEKVKHGSTEKTYQNPYQRQTVEAITQYRTQILQSLERYDSLGRTAEALKVPFVITHGDPTPGNIILDSNNRLHLIDWDGVRLGPPEKDLVAFTGERFEIVLERYLTKRDNDLTLHADIFGFYIYEWTLNEIRDYGTKILFDKDSEAQQNEYDWESLQEYLPPNQEVMESGIAAIRKRLTQYQD